jgi:dsRNA-specific ribonuclease
MQRLNLQKSNLKMTVKNYMNEIISSEGIKKNNNALRKELIDIYFENQKKADLEEEKKHGEIIESTELVSTKCSLRSKEWDHNKIWLVYQLPQIQDREVNFRNEIKSFEKLDRSFFSKAYQDCNLHEGRLKLFPSGMMEETRVLDYHFGSLLELPSICYNLERFMDVQELSLIMQWTHVQTDFLTQALQNSSFDPEFNYETLETVGDSCLKMIVSLFLFDQNSKANEEDMTNKKVTLINNQYLAQKADQKELQFFIRVFRNKNLRFKIPLLNISKGSLNFQNQIRNLGKSLVRVF